MPIKDDHLSRAGSLLNLVQLISDVGADTMPYLRSEAMAELRALDDAVRKAKEEEQGRALAPSIQPEPAKAVPNPENLPDHELGGRYAELDKPSQPVRRPV